MRETMDRLRAAYRDQIRPLRHLRIMVPGMLIKMRYIDEEHGGEGVFRVHPRLSQIEIWPDMGSAVNSLKATRNLEEQILDRIILETRVKRAKEAVMEARDEGKPPDRRDLATIKDTRIKPVKYRRPPSGARSRVIRLQEIQDAVETAKYESSLARRGQKRRMEIALRPNAPVKLASFSPVKLLVEFL